MSRIRDTLRWLWGMVRNPDVVWLDADTGEVVERERWSRRQRWHVLRPSWIHYAFTTARPCGCRRRFGLWRVIVCSDHLGWERLLDE